MMGSGIALLPSNLASIGSVALFGWLIAMFGALALAYVYARLSTVNPQSGGPVAYAGEISPAFGYQTGVLYYHANWIGNLAIAITAVSYLSVFFPILNHPIPAGIACVAVVWFFTILNFFGGSMIGKVTTFGVIALLIPVVGTATFGWLWFDPQVYMDNWNVSGTTDLDATCRSVLLCLWAFIGIESASVSSGLVDNPRRTVPLATMLGALLAGLVYIGSSQAIAGMFPASVTAASGAPFALSASLMVGDWAAPVVSFGIDNTKAMGLLRELCNFRRDYDRNLEIKEAIPSLYKKDPSFYDGMRLQELAQGIHKLIVEHDLPNMMFHAFETLPKMVMTPFDAFQRELNGEVEEVRIQDMQDKVNANMILPYPPGVPLVMPGEMLTADNRAVLDFMLMLCEIGEHFPGFETDIHGAYRQPDGSYTVKVLKM